MNNIYKVKILFKNFYPDLKTYRTIFSTILAQSFKKISYKNRAILSGNRSLPYLIYFSIVFISSIFLTLKFTSKN